MILHAFDIPETHDERAAWLESQLTGVNLPEVVAELRAVHGPGDRTSVESMLGQQLAQVLESGLTKLDSQHLQMLFKNPETLFQLQEQVFLHGSRYWNQVPSANEVNVDASFLTSVVTSADNSPTPHPAVPASRGAWYRHPLFVCLATAAIVIAGIDLRQRFQPSGATVTSGNGWGWDRAGALRTDVTAATYLNNLADSADEWFNKKPATARNLAVRIAQFRQGCSTLILADHAALAEADREWLVDKCRAWAVKLDASLVAVEAGEPVLDVRAEADEIIRKLAAALRNRAKELSA